MFTNTLNVSTQSVIDTMVFSVNALVTPLSRRETKRTADGFAYEVSYRRTEIFTPSFFIIRQMQIRIHSALLAQALYELDSSELNELNLRISLGKARSFIRSILREVQSYTGCRAMFSNAEHAFVITCLDRLQRHGLINTNTYAEFFINAEIKHPS